MEAVVQTPGATEPQRPGRHRLTQSGSVVAVDDPRDVLVRPRRPGEYEREPLLAWPGEIHIHTYDENTLLRYLAAEGWTKAFRLILASYQRGLLDGGHEGGVSSRGAAERAAHRCPSYYATEQLEGVRAEFTRTVLEWGRLNPEPPRQQ